MQQGIIIQARSGSSRLPNKMVMEFYSEKGILQILLEKIIDAKLNIPIVLATTLKKEDDRLVELAESLGIFVYRGSENNVLDRFIKAANVFNIKNIIRICADNPFLDLFSLELLIGKSKGMKCDYMGFKTIDDIPTIKTHYGFWCESVKLSALESVSKRTSETLYLEHVTNFIYANLGIFICDFIYIPKELNDSNIRMTLDTMSDFIILKEIYAEFIQCEDRNLIDLYQMVKKNTYWINSMKLEIEKNKK